MNEFEWRQQMRKLQQPIAPSRELWHAIEAALEDRGTAAAPPPASPRPTRQPWLLAAALAAVFLLAGGIGLRLQQSMDTGAATAAWHPSDPRLGGAAIELGAARIELQQAMQQSPHSPSLQRLLARTERQQAQLRRLANEAG